MTIGPGKDALLAAALVLIGLAGLLTRRDAIGALTGVLLTLAGAEVALVSAGRFSDGAARPLAAMAVALLVALVSLAVATAGSGLAVLAGRRAIEGDLDRLGESPLPHGPSGEARG